MSTYADEGFMQAVENQYSRNADDRLIVRFSNFPCIDSEESEKQKRPIFKDIEHIMIVVPGDKENVVHRPVNIHDKRRFASKYKDWKDGLASEGYTGTPLSVWPAVTRSQVEELKFFNVHTVEHLADMSDSVSQKFAGIQSLKQKAKDFLESAKSSVQLDKMRSELGSRDDRIAALEKALQDLKSAPQQNAKR